MDLFNACHSASGDLDQRSFCLWEPESHLHGTVQLDGGGQGNVGVRPLTALGIQGSKAMVAVRLEWAHP
jgi:hypothetical protein